MEARAAAPGVDSAAYRTAALASTSRNPVPPCTETPAGGHYLVPAMPDPTTSSPESLLLEQRDAIHRLAAHLLHQRADAEDVAQEVLVLGLSRPDGARTDFAAWLRGVTRHLAWRSLRTAKRRRARESQARRHASGADTADTVIRIEERRRLLAALQQLQEPYRTTLVLRYLDDCKPREIARRQGVPVETVYSRQKRGLASLRRQLQGDRRSGAWSVGLLGLMRAELRQGASGAGVLGMKKSTVAVCVLLCVGLVLGWLAAPWWWGGAEEAREGESLAGLTADPHEAGPITTPGATAQLEATGPSPDSVAPTPGIVGAPTGVLRGTVRAEDSGVGIAGAHVLLLQPVGVWDGESVQLETRTDARGQYVIEGVPAGKWVLYAFSEAFYLPQTVRIDQQRTPEGVTHFGPPPDLAVLIPAAGGDFARDLTLKRGFEIRGTVVDAGGAPVAGAEVHVRNHLARVASHWGVKSKHASRAAARTQEDGRFLVQGLLPMSGVTRLPGPPGSRRTLPNGWRLRAEKPGHVPTLSARTEVGPGIATPDITITLPAAGRIDGRVVDGDRAVPNAWVRWGAADNARSLYAAPAPGGPTWRTRCDADGRFSIAGVPVARAGLLAVTGAGAPRFTVEVPALAAGESHELTVKLPEGARVRGRLLDEAGHALGGRRVLFTYEVEGRPQRLLAQSDERGGFQFAGLPDAHVRGRLLVEVEPTRAVGIADEVAPGPEVSDYTLRVRRLLLRVVDVEGRAVPYCRVTVNADADKPPPPFFLRPRDPEEVINGEVDRLVFQAAPYRIEVTQPQDHARRALNLKPHVAELDDLPATPLLIRLRAGQVVEGDVIDERGAGLSGVVVRSGLLRTATDGEGAFQLGGLEGGDVVLEIVAPPGYVDPGAIAGAVGGPPVRIRLAREGVVRGTLTYEDGRPVRGGWVRASWTDAEGRARRRSGALSPDGAWRIAPVPRDVALTILATNWGPGVAEGFAPVQQYDVRANGKAVALVLKAGHVIEGVVQDERGAPVTNVSITARRARGSRQQAGAADPDATGRFRIHVSEPGDYELSAFRGTRIAGPLAVAAPATGVVFEIASPTTLSGKVVGGGGGNWMIRAWPEGAPERAGLWQKAGRDGTFRIQLRGRGSDRFVIGGYDARSGRRRIARSGPVAPGRSDVELRVEDARGIEGRVEWAEAAAGAAARPVLGYELWSPGWRASGTLAVDAKGRFVIGKLAVGRYRLTVRARGAVHAPVVIEGVDAGRTDLLVRIPAIR